MEKKWTLNKKFIIYVMLLFAFANASLRFTESGITSFYRLVAPFLILLLCRKIVRHFQKELILFVCFGMYSVVISAVYYGHVAYEYYMFAIYMLVEYIFIRYMNITDIDFNEHFFGFLDRVTKFLILFCFLQAVFRFPMPFVNMARYPGVNLFFSNENELGEALACMGILYLFRWLFKQEREALLKILCIAVLLYMNDAKLSIIGFAIAVMMMCFYALLSHRIGTVRLTRRQKIIICIGIIIIVLACIIMFDAEFTFRDYKIDINNLLISAVRSIVHETPLPGSGSITDRTNAIIYGLIELKNTKLFGIGWGNSDYMLTLPQYKLLTAKSMHNIIMQFLCEFGYLAIGVYMILIGRLLKGVQKVNQSWTYLLKLVYAVAFVFISSQSSIGILSNYMTWAVTIYVVLLEPEQKAKSNRPVIKGCGGIVS